MAGVFAAGLSGRAVRCGRRSRLRCRTWASGAWLWWSCRDAGL